MPITTTQTTDNSTSSCDLPLTLNASLADGADFDSTEFAGDMDLTSANIKTARLGEGDDTVVINGEADASDSSYDLGEGNNSIEFNVDLAGSVVAADGVDEEGEEVAYDNSVTVNADVTATGSIELGNGNNTVRVVGDGDVEVSEGDMLGAITVGDGDNIVAVSDDIGTGASDGETSITFGDGNNTLAVGFELSEEGVWSFTDGDDIKTADIQFGNGDNLVVVNNDIEGSAKLSFGTGDNTVLVGDEIHDDAQISFAGGNNEVAILDFYNGEDGSVIGANLEDVADVLASGSSDLSSSASITFGGDGDNVLTVWDDVQGEATVTFEGDGNNRVTVVENFTNSASITFGDGNNVMEVGDGVDDNATITFGNGDNLLSVEGEMWGSSEVDASGVTVSFGNGDNTVTVGGKLVDGVFVDSGVNGEDGDVENAAITFGEGTNFMQVDDSVVDSSVTFGDGNGNELIVGESIVAAQPGTITFGDGDANSLSVGDSLVGDAVVFGDGAGNEFTIGGAVSGGASITLGDGGNTGEIAGAVVQGSQVTFGDGADELSLGSEAGNDTALVSAVDVSTNIMMGAGNDDATIYSDGEDESADEIIQSGAFLDGGADEDTLTLVAAGDTDLIVRTHAQVATIDLGAAPFEVGDEITVTFTRGDEEFTVSVIADELIQGPENLAATVAEALSVAISGDAEAGPVFNAVNSGSLITLTSDNPHEDFDIVWQVNGGDAVDATVVQISDTQISSFETLELVALDIEGQEDNTTINANFDLIEGTNTIKLESNVDKYADNVDQNVYGIAVSGIEPGVFTHFNGYFEGEIGGKWVEINFNVVDGVIQLDPDSGFDYSGSMPPAIAAQIDAFVYGVDYGFVYDNDPFERGLTLWFADEAFRDQLLQDSLDEDAIGLVFALEPGFDYPSNVDDEENFTPSDISIGTIENLNVQGGVTTYELDNLNGGEAIHVSGYEASATGNSQVSEITVGDVDNDHLVGDKIVVNLGGVEVEYTVTSADLSGDTAVEDAANIATSLAAAIADAASGAGLEVVRDANVITLTGQPGEEVDVDVDHMRLETQNPSINGVLSEPQPNWNVAEALADQMGGLQAGDVITITLEGVEGTFTHTVTEADCLRIYGDSIINGIVDTFGDNASFDWGTVQFAADATIEVARTVDLLAGGSADKTSVELLKSASATDDGVADVVIDATLAADATDTTMDLTVAGQGDFDISITGGEDSAFDALDLKLGDSHDHTIDTGGIALLRVPALMRDFIGEYAGPDFEPQVIDFLGVRGVTIRVAEEFFLGEFNGFEVPYQISTDGGVTFQEGEGLLVDFLIERFGEDEEVAYINMLASVETITFYDGEPGAEGVETYVVDSISEAFGNFRDAITVSDVDGVDTTGADIVLDNVLAHTVTSTSNANLTIDQYSVRDFNILDDIGEGALPDESSDLFVVDDAITVSTEGGDDHLITLAQSAMAEGSSIDLGEGRNTLSLGWGEGAVVTEEPIDLDEYNIPRFDVSATYDAESDTVASFQEFLDGAGSVELPVIEVGTRVDGVINNGTERDAFAVNLEAGKTYQISFFTSEALGYDGLDTDFYAYGPNGERIVVGLLANGEDAFDDEDMDAFDSDSFVPGYTGEDIDDVYEGEARVFTATVSGTYYFEIAPHDVEYEGAYTFEVAELDTDGDLNLDFSSMNYTGGLAELELLNDVVFYSDKQLVMPGGVDGVEVLTLTDVYGEDADLTVVGAADDFAINSAEDFILEGTLSVADAAGAEIEGNLVVTGETGDVEFNIGNNALASLDVTAGFDADVDLTGKSGEAFEIGALSITAGSGDTSAALRLQNNIMTEAVIGVEGGVSLSGGDTRIFVEDSEELDLTMGNVTLSAEDNAWVFVENLRGSTVELGGLDLHGADTQVYFGDYDSAEDFISMSDITVTGNVTMMAEDYALLGVFDTEMSNVSIAVDADSADTDISLTSCGSDAEVVISGNLNNHDPFNPDPLADGFIQDVNIALGDVALDAGEDAYLDIDSNVDDTFFGNLSISVGDVSMLSYSDATVNVYENQAADISIGDVSMRSQGEGAVIVDGNFGEMYENSLVDPVNPRIEVDYADIDIASVDIDADETAFLAVNGQDIATVDIGDVDLLGDTGAGLEIVSNGVYSVVEYDVVDSADWPAEQGPLPSVEVTLADVTITATTGLAGAAIGLNYSGYEGENRNVDTHVDIGELSITSEGSDAEAEANLIIANNFGADSKGKVDIKKVTTSSATSTNFFVYNNSLLQGSVSAAAFAGIAIGDVSMVAAENANLAITDNYGDGSDDTVMTFGDVSLTANSGELADVAYNAQIDIGGLYGEDDNSYVDITMQDVTLDGANTGFFVNGNSDSEVSIGDLELTSSNNVVDSSAHADVTLNGNSDTSIDIDSVTITSDIDAQFEIDGNAYTTVAVGDVTINSGDNETLFHIVDNVNSTISVANASGEEGVRGLIEIDAGKVGQYDDYFGFDVSNSDSDVALGDIDIDASGLGEDSDVTVRFEGFSDDVDVGDVSIDADSDVFFVVNSNWVADTMQLGDINIEAGLEPVVDGVSGEDVSSDIFFFADEMDGNDLNDYVDDAGQQITLTANSTGTGEGNIYVDIQDAGDLTNLTVIGTSAEIYLSGDIGPDGDGGQNTFTLDLSGMTGTGTMENYNPYGEGADENRGQDAGTYVVTVGASFDDDLRDVIVEIGTGDLVYNAQHSEFFGDGGDFVENGSNHDSDWYGDEGWFSLGDGLDLVPQARVVTFTGLAEDIGGWDDGELGNTEYDFTLTLNGTELFNGVITYTDDSNLWSLSSPLDPALLSDYSLAITTVSDQTPRLTLTGPADGSSFTAVISGVNKVNAGDPGVASFDFTSEVTTPGDMADDGEGNSASEVFTFTGDDIGEVVIGGFNANAVLSSESGIDYLDFTMFEGGVIDQLSDLEFFTDDGTDQLVGASDNGYFNDVIITSEHFDGSIRLVGLAENDNWESALQNSILFHTPEVA